MGQTCRVLLALLPGLWSLAGAFYEDNLYFTVQTSSTLSVNFVPMFGGSVPNGGPHRLVWPAEGELHGCDTLSENGTFSQPISNAWIIFERGLCDPIRKVRNAAEAGALGVIIANFDGEDIFPMATRPQVNAPTLPVLMISYQDSRTIFTRMTIASGSMTITLTPAGNLDAAEREVLKELFPSPPRWSQLPGTRGWETLDTLPSLDPCHTPRLMGIWCENGHVVALILTDVQANGTLPAALSLLPQLRMIAISGTGLSGPLPCNWTQLSNLRTILLDDLEPGLSSLPECIGDFPALRHLSIAGNQIESIPAELWTLSTIRKLRLARNRLNGTLPSNILSLLSDLRYLDLSDNQLSGHLPTLRSNNKITYINLSKNQLILNPSVAGTNTWLDGLSVVRYLNLGHNRLNGVLPRLWLGSTSPLRTLDLSHNELYGIFNDANYYYWGYLYSLEYLYLQHNRLEGPMTRYLSVTSLIEVNLGYNNLTEQVSGVDASARNPALIIYSVWPGTIRKVNLEYNRIEGDWSPGWAGLSLYLSELRLAGNRITSLPRDLFSDGVGALRALDVSHNNLTGYLPALSAPSPMWTMLKLDGNPHLKARDGQLPSWIRASPDEWRWSPGQGYRCRTLQSALRPSMILTLDPSFNDYEHCICHPGMYGKPPDCKPVPEVVVHNSTEPWSDDMLGNWRRMPGMDTKFIVHQDSSPTPVRWIRLNLTVHVPDFRDETDSLQVYEGRGTDGRLLLSLNGDPNLESDQSYLVTAYDSAATIVFDTKDSAGRHFTVLPVFEYYCPPGWVEFENTCGELWKPNNTYRSAVRISIAGVCFVLLLVAFYLWQNRQTALIRALTPIFCYLTLLFSGLCAIAGLFYTADEETKVLCLFRPWFTALPLLGMMALLLTKTVRVWMIFDSKTLRRPYFTNEMMVALVAFLAVIEIAFLVFFSAAQLSVPVLTRGGGVIDHKVLHRCSVDDFWYSVWNWTHVAYIGLVTIATGYAAWRARKAPTRFNESPPLAGATFVLIFICIAIFGAQQYLGESPDDTTLTRGLGQSLGVLLFNAILWAPKLWALTHPRGRELETDTREFVAAVRDPPQNLVINLGRFVSPDATNTSELGPQLEMPRLQPIIALDSGPQVPPPQQPLLHPQPAYEMKFAANGSSVIDPMPRTPDADTAATAEPRSPRGAGLATTGSNAPANKAAENGGRAPLPGAVES